MFTDNILHLRYSNGISDSFKSLNIRSNPFLHSDEGSVNAEESIRSYGSLMSFDLDFVDPDHFDRPLADCDQLSSVEDLTAAVKACKQRILAMVDDTDAKNKLIERLIEMNGRLHLAKEARKDSGESEAVIGNQMQEVAGHRLVRAARGSLLTLRHCEACGGNVKTSWRVLCCRDCDVHVHADSRCIQMLQRGCPAAGLRDDASSVLQSQIGGLRGRCPSSASLPNNGFTIDIDSFPLCGDLTAQKFLCAECSRPLSPVSSSFSLAERPLFCHYSHKFFCSRCHWGNRHLIPAVYFVLGLWRRMPVSRGAFISLKYSWPRTLLRVPSHWQQHHPSAEAVLVIRRRLFFLRAFLQRCAPLSKICQSSPSWIVDQPFLVTMAFVEAIDDGSALQTVQVLYSEIAAHIPGCETCQGLCQPCSLCDDPTKISPVSDGVWGCSRCGIVCIHEKCALARAWEKATYFCHNCSGSV